MEDQDENYAFVLLKARLNTCGHVVFTVSTKEIKLESNNTSSKKLIKIPCGKFNNVRFDIDASQNGIGLVYHRSDCGYPRHRVYGNGGDWSGSFCGDWVYDGLERSICGVNYKLADIIWYGDKYISKGDSGWSTSIRNTYNNIKNQNEDGGGRHNWTPKEIDNVVNGMIFLQAC